MRTFFALKKWRMEYFDDVIKCHALVRTWSIGGFSIIVHVALVQNDSEAVTNIHTVMDNSTCTIIEWKKQLYSRQNKEPLNLIKSFVSSHTFKAIRRHASITIRIEPLILTMSHVCIAKTFCTRPTGPPTAQGKAQELQTVIIWRAYHFSHLTALVTTVINLHRSLLESEASVSPLAYHLPTYR